MPEEKRESESETGLGFLALPESAAAAVPGVVVIPDVWGLSAHYRDQARRLAASGFAALAIDPYRLTGPLRISQPSEALAWIAGLSDPLMLETVQQGVNHLAAQPQCTGGVGVVGFCMGGQYALLAACACSGISACASFYGMVRYAQGLSADKKPRQPLDALATLQCPVLGFYGEEDPIIPVADVHALREKLAAAPAPGEAVLYPGAGHAFANDTRPDTYRPRATRDAWGRLLPFLRRALA